MISTLSTPAVSQTYEQGFRKIIDECISWIDSKGKYTFTKEWFELTNQLDLGFSFGGYIGLHFPFALITVYDDQLNIGPQCSVEPDVNGVPTSEADVTLETLFGPKGREVEKNFELQSQNTRAPDQNAERHGLEKLVTLLLEEGDFLQVADTASNTKSLTSFLTCGGSPKKIDIRPKYEKAPKRDWQLSIDTTTNPSEIEKLQSHCPSE